MFKTFVKIDNEDHEIEFNTFDGNVEDAKVISTGEWIEDAFTPSQVDSVFTQLHKYLEWRNEP